MEAENVRWTVVETLVHRELTARSLKTQSAKVIGRRDPLTLLLLGFAGVAYLTEYKK